MKLSELFEKSIIRVQGLKPIRDRMVLKQWKLISTLEGGEFCYLASADSGVRFEFDLNFVDAFSTITVEAEIKLDLLLDELPLTGARNPIDKEMDISMSDTSEVDRFTLRMCYVFLSIWRRIMKPSKEELSKDGYIKAVIPIKLNRVTTSPAIDKVDTGIFASPLTEGKKVSYIDTGVKVEVKPEDSGCWGKKIDSSKIFYDYAKADSKIFDCYVSPIKSEAVYVDWSDTWDNK